MANLPAAPDSHDRHIISKFLLKSVIFGGGIVGIVIYARKSRFFARYEKVSQIPSVVFSRGIELRGIVRAVYTNGVLKVEHKPTLTLPNFLSRQQYLQPGLLSLRLAGIDVLEVGADYLVKDLRLKNKSILFTALKGVDDEFIDSSIFFKRGRFFYTNLNVELIRRGYARVLPLDDKRHVDALKKNMLYSRLIYKLLLSEKIADRRGLGSWRRDTWAEIIVSYPSLFKQIVASASITRFLVLAVAFGKELAVKSSRTIAKAKKMIIMMSVFCFYIAQKFSSMSSKLLSKIKQKM